MQILFFISLILAFVSVAVLLFNPVSGILLVTLVKPIVDTSFYVSFGGGLSLTRIYGVLIPLVIFFYMLAAKNKGQLRYMPLRALWLLYAVDVFMFSGIIAYKEGLLASVDVFFRHINGFVGFYMFQAFFHRDDKLKHLLTAMIVAGIFPILTTLYQIVTGIQWHVLAHSASEGFVRSSGLYYHINTIRYYSYQTLIGMLLYWTMFARPRVFAKIIGAVILVSILVITYKTYSKAGYLEIVLWMLIWTVLRRKFAILSAILISTLLILPFYATDIANDIYVVFHKEVAVISGDVEVGETALAGRLPGWGARLEQWADLNPLLQVFGSGQVSTGAHNDYIMMLFHGGVLGLVIYLVLFGTIGVRLLKELLIKVEPLGIAAFMLYVTFLVETVGLEPSSYPHFQWLVWGMAGLFLRRRQEQRENPRDDAEENVVAEQPEKARILQRVKR